MVTNGEYAGEFERLVAMTERIDRTTGEHSSSLGLLEHHLSKISQNTSTIAAHYGQVQEDNRELSKLAAGKQQVPLALFIVLLVFGGVWVLIDKIEDGDIEVRIPSLGIEITHHNPE